MGNSDLQMDTGQMDYSGRDLTRAGQVCGIIGTALLLLQIFMVGVMLSMVAFHN